MVTQGSESPLRPWICTTAPGWYVSYTCRPDTYTGLEPKTNPGSIQRMSHHAPNTKVNDTIKELTCGW